MPDVWLRRAALMRALYRARQFLWALLASLRPLDDAEQAEVRAVLTASAWPLFASMPRADQRHSLNVMHALEHSQLAVAAGTRALTFGKKAGSAEGRQAGSQGALLQAALLHDCAKHAGGVRLWHRGAAVLLKALRPGILKCWGAGQAPARGNWRYPFWAYVNHPSLGAGLAAQTGCPPLAVWLIRQHQGALDPAADHLAKDDGRLAMLAALQAADDDN
jgi:hypothetical protein